MADQTRLGVGRGEEKGIVFVGFGEGGDGVLVGVWGFLSAAADCERVRLSEEKLKCAADPHPCWSTSCSSTTAELPLFTAVILCQLSLLSLPGTVSWDKPETEWGANWPCWPVY
jgi:hypothetical protein